MEIQCDKCGATLHYNPGTTELVCEYCGNTVHIPQADDGKETQSDRIVPFEIDKDKANAAAREFMAAQAMAPDDLVREFR